jgi:hypothetical protein
MINGFTQGMLLQSLCDLCALGSEVEGMKAKNKERESQGYSLAYGEEAFNEKANEMRSIGNYARELAQRTT